MSKVKMQTLFQLGGSGPCYAAVSVPVAWLRLHNLKPKDRVQVAYDDEQVIIRPLGGNDLAKE